MGLSMRTLSVSTLILVLIESLLISSYWLKIPLLNEFVLLMLHGLVALVACYVLSRLWQQPTMDGKISGLILFNFIFFMPLIGAIILWLFAIRKTLRKPNTEATLNMDAEAQTDEDIYYFSAPKQHHFGGSKQTRDLISTLDDDTYLKLLVASRHLPDKEAYTLLKEALSSPFESARLMAFTLKGTLEERLQGELQQKLEELKQTKNKGNIAELHLSIAKDYMHLLDIGLLSENNETLLNKARDHCIKAIRLNDKSAYAFQALSKILKHQGHAKQAQRAQIKAVDLGLPLERLYST
jgi:uncharacterized membrane protein